MLKWFGERIFNRDQVRSGICATKKFIIIKPHLVLNIGDIHYIREKNHRIKL